MRRLKSSMFYILLFLFTLPTWLDILGIEMKGSVSEWRILMMGWMVFSGIELIRAELKEKRDEWEETSNE